MNSCTAGLHLSMLVADLKPGDEVMVPPLTFVASANCVVYSGGTPVFADICARTWNIDSREVARKINRKTRVIIP